MQRHNLLEEDLQDYLYESSESDKNGSHIAENYTTPYPMVLTYYEVGEGQYPEKEDGYFLPAEQNDFVSRMFDKCQKYAEGEHADRFSDKHEPGWRERFKRAWASFTRDVHFRFMVSNGRVFDKVHYSIERDRKSKIDLTGYLNGIEYHMHLFVNSASGRKNLRRKINNKSSEATDILVPLSPNGYKKTVRTRGDNLWLYSHQHIESLKDVVHGEEKSMVEHMHQDTKIERL